MNFRGQGTLEYLVIIAVVVVISLFVAVLFLNQTNTAVLIQDNSTKFPSTGIGGINIVDSVTSSSGDAIISLKNDSGNNLIIEELKVIDSSGEGESISSNCVGEFGAGHEMICLIPDANLYCPCTSGQTTICVFELKVKGKIQPVIITKEITCEVTATTYTLSYSATEGGTISGTTLQKIISNGNGTSVTAIPAERYVFVDWNDGVTTPTRTDYGINDNINVKANFEFVPECEIDDDCGIGKICDDGVCIDEPIIVEENYFIFLIRPHLNNFNYKLQVDDAVDININWGDGNIEIINGTNLLSHIYTTNGDYNISINGTASRIAFGEDLVSAIRLVDIYTPLYPAVTGITSAKKMFKDINITSFSSNDFLYESSKNITDMEWMFHESHNFNQLLKLDTNNVENMKGMFSYATNFNQTLDFNTSKVITMESMFNGANKFNQPLNFDTQNVTTLYSMFRQAYDFNQPLDFNTSKVEDMSYLFLDANSFNQPLINWDTSNVTSMHSMFDGATNFNQPLDFNTSKVTGFGYMFEHAINFNQDLSGWDVSAWTYKYNFDFNTPSWILPKPYFPPK